MTPEQQRLVLSLIVAPGSGRQSSLDEFLRLFGASDGRNLGLELLRDAVERRDAVDVEMALIVCSTFGVTTGHFELLLELASADWHFKHEDVVTALGRYRRPDAVDVLYGATQWVPSYLEFDEARALATKAIWALGQTPGEESERALARLLDSDSDILRQAARRQLKSRNVP